MPSSEESFDVTVIGGGIVGTSIAWRLARTTLRVALIESGCDIANGSTRANSGILHSGIHEKPESQMFRRCRSGLRWYRTWAPKLDIPLVDRPSLIVAFTEEDQVRLKGLAEQHASTLSPKLLDQAELQSCESCLSPHLRAGLLIADSAQISPYEACRAILENAIANGLIFKPEHHVKKAARKPNGWLLEGDDWAVASGIVILATGAGAQGISHIFGIQPPSLSWVSGAYFMMDRRLAGTLHHIVFGPPQPHTKGFLAQETVHGNLLLGPDAVSWPHPAISLDDETAVLAQWERLSTLWQSAIQLVPGLERRDVIRSFTGIRHTAPGEDFALLDLLADARLMALHGIRSPGLTAAPALADEVVTALTNGAISPEKIRERANLVETRTSPEQATARLDSPLVCRCEKVHEATISEAWSRGATTIETVRWMTRAGMGRCQGGFCRPRILGLLSRWSNREPGEIPLKEPGSNLVSGWLK